MSERYPFHSFGRCAHLDECEIVASLNPMRKKKPSRQLLDQSCAWIREHWNATNQDVPDDLLQQWMYDPDDDDSEPPGFQFAAFTFGYLQYDFISRNVPPGVAQTMPASEILQCFQAWQMKLALAEIHRRTGLRIKPMPLFHFPHDERIEAWADVPFPRG